MIRHEIDIKENNIFEQYPGTLEILLRDHTTQNNILWATDNYVQRGEEYFFDSEILPELITGVNGDIIMPRVQKDRLLQQNRSKDMAEVFTPSWVCNAQINLIDNAWFGRENVFNTENKISEGYQWNVNYEKIQFPELKTWKDYIRDTRLEMTCGEGPYLTSRYDTTTGDFIPIQSRIGIIDRKLRIINENVQESGEWLNAAQTAYKNTYAFEYHGDSLLLAREALLYTFIENYMIKFNKEPLLKSIHYMAYIISWNIWQMDGLKGVIPKSCNSKTVISATLFGDDDIEEIPCEGCQDDNMYKHNGIYSLVKDWQNKDLKKRKKGRKIKFVELLKDFNL